MAARRVLAGWIAVALAIGCSSDGARGSPGLDPLGSTGGAPEASSTTADDARGDETSGGAAPGDADTTDADDDDTGSTSTGEDVELPAPPSVGLWHTEAQLDTMRERAALAPWDAAIAAVLAEADDALGHVPAAVPVFDVPAYYDDPEGHEAAKAALAGDGYAAYALALGYQLAPDAATAEAYAGKAAEILDAWATINTSIDGDDGDLVMIYKGVHLLYAADLIGGWSGWQPDAFRGWTANVFRGAAEREAERDNNRGDWGNFGAICAAALLDDAVGVQRAIESMQDRIATTIDAQGELPEENNRTNSGIWYTYFALAAMTGTAWVARNVGATDLLLWTSPNGRSLHLALSRLFVWCLDPQAWPYPLPDGIEGELWRLLYPCADELEIPTPQSWPGNLFEAMSSVYDEPQWEAWVLGYRPQRGWQVFLYPTLMRDDP